MWYNLLILKQTGAAGVHPPSLVQVRVADPVRVNPVSQVYVATLPSLTPLDRDSAPLTWLDSCPQVGTVERSVNGKNQISLHFLGIKTTLCILQ